MREIILRKVISIIAISLFAANCFSQNGLWYSGNGNDTAKTNRFVLINNSAKVKGTMSTDYFFVSKTLTVDSINVRSITVNNTNIFNNLKSDSLTVAGGAHILGPLKIGINSLQLGTVTPGGLDNQITTDGTQIVFGKYPGNFSNIQVGIGTTIPFVNLPGMYGLDVNGIVNISQLHSGYYIAGNEVLQYHGGTPTPVISNIFVGITAGMHTIGSDNAFVGFEAGYDNTDGINNTAVGSGALRYTTIENNNTAIGYKALYSLGINLNNPSSLKANDNTAVGAQTLYMNETGYENTAIGKDALYTNKGGHANIAIGNGSMYSGFECKGNTAVGIGSLYNSKDGLYNTALGNQALYNNNSVAGSNGNYNTAVGNEAGLSNFTGNGNTFVGNKANPQYENLQNATAIGANAMVATDNCMVLGSIENINGAPQGSTVKVGIGTTAPQKRLEIVDGIAGNSGLRLTNLTTATTPMPNPGSGVLAVNGDGDVVYVEIESYLKKIELLEARIQRLEETLALTQPTQTTSISNE